MPDSTINDLTAVLGADVDVDNDSLAIWTSNRTGKITPGQLLTALGQVGGFVSVKEPRFGAVGDGVADDSVALQAAITEAFNSGAELVGPPGDFVYGTPLTLPDTAGVFKMRGLGRPK